MTRIIETEVLCTNTSMQELGLETEDEWIPFALDLDRVGMVKYLKDDQVEDNDGKTTIYCVESLFIINYEYKKFLKIWKEYKENNESRNTSNK